MPCEMPPCEMGRRDAPQRQGARFGTTAPTSAPKAGATTVRARTHPNRYTVAGEMWQWVSTLFDHPVPAFHVSGLRILGTLSEKCWSIRSQQGQCRHSSIATYVRHRLCQCTYRRGGKMGQLTEIVCRFLVGDSNAWQARRDATERFAHGFTVELRQPDSNGRNFYTFCLDA